MIISSYLHSAKEKLIFNNCYEKPTNSKRSDKQEVNGHSWDICMYENTDPSFLDKIHLKFITELMTALQKNKWSKNNDNTFSKNFQEEGWC